MIYEEMFFFQKFKLFYQTWTMSWFLWSIWFFVLKNVNSGCRVRAWYHWDGCPRKVFSSESSAQNLMFGRTVFYFGKYTATDFRWKSYLKFFYKIWQELLIFWEKKAINKKIYVLQISILNCKYFPFYFLQFSVKNFFVQGEDVLTKYKPLYVTQWGKLLVRSPIIPLL